MAFDWDEWEQSEVSKKIRTLISFLYSASTKLKHNAAAKRLVVTLKIIMQLRNRYVLDGTDDNIMWKLESFKKNVKVETDFDIRSQHDQIKVYV